jgi:hypothetical protein
MRIRDLPIDTIITLNSYLTPAELSRVSYTSLFFFNIDNSEYWKAKLVKELQIPAQLLQSFPPTNSLPFKEIYKQLYYFKQRAPQQFQWFYQNFVAINVDMPPLYASNIDLTAYNKSVLKLYLDISAMIGNLHLLSFLMENGIAPNWKTLKCAGLSQNIELVIVLNETYHAIQPPDHMAADMAVKYMQTEYAQVLKAIAKTGDAILFKYLFSYVEPLDKLPTNQLITDVIRSGNKELVTFLIEEHGLYFKDNKFTLTDEMLPAAALSGSIDLINYLMKLYGIDKLTSTLFYAGEERFFKNIGRSGNKVLIELTVVPEQQLLWEKIFNNADFVESEIYQGILISGNLALAKEQHEKLHINLNVDSEIYFDAACISNNPELLEWVLSKMEFNWRSVITAAKIAVILDAKAIDIFAWMMDPLHEVPAAVLPDKKELLIQCGNSAVTSDIEDLDLRLVNYLSYSENEVPEEIINYYNEESSQFSVTEALNYVKLALISNNAQALRNTGDMDFKP